MVAAAPGAAKTHQVIAQRQAGAMDIPSALEHYRTLIEIDPHLPGVPFEYGQALLLDTASEASLIEARKQLEAALADDPKDFNAARQLAEALLCLSDPEAAAEYFLRALQLNPNDDAAHFGLGKLHAASGDVKSAASHLESAMSKHHWKGGRKGRSLPLVIGVLFLAMASGIAFAQNVNAGEIRAPVGIRQGPCFPASSSRS